MRCLFPLAGCQTKVMDGRTLFFTAIPPDLVTRVVLGLRCPPELVRQVEEAKAKRGLGFEMLRAHVHRTDFKLEYKPVEIGAVS